MKHIIENWAGETTGSALWNFYFGDLKVGALDIETTGLNPAVNKFILGGLFDTNKGILHQVLAENRAEEKEALSEFLELTAEMDVIVTYNGRHFDVPFMASRCENALQDYYAGRGLRLYNLDLYQVIRGYSALRSILPNLKQKTVENYMGLWETRTDEISGKESVDLYSFYEKTGDSSAKEKILLHNNDDVRQLTRLTNVVTKCDFHRAMNCIGFPVKQAGHLLEVAKAGITGDTLRISGRQLKNPVNYIGFQWGKSPAEVRFQDDMFLIELPLLRHWGLGIVDLEQLGMAEGRTLEKYPLCREGFLVVHDSQELKYRELNDFVITFLKAFIDTEVLV